VADTKRKEGNSAATLLPAIFKKGMKELYGQ
jgi:hypothetical protein